MAKKAKRAKVIFKEIKREYSIYECPHCHVRIEGAGINRNVTRFLCLRCNNEIIVDNDFVKKK